MISWFDPEPVLYGGVDPLRPEFPTLSGDLTQSRRTWTRRCGPQFVAPADIPIPSRDPRVVVTKGNARAAGIWDLPPQAWVLTLAVGDAPSPTWHKTKRDAVAAGHRQLAIMLWHAGQTGSPEESGAQLTTSSTVPTEPEPSADREILRPRAESADVIQDIEVADPAVGWGVLTASPEPAVGQQNLTHAPAQNAPTSSGEAPAGRPSSDPGEGAAIDIDPDPDQAAKSGDVPTSQAPPPRPAVETSPSDADHLSEPLTIAPAGTLLPSPPHPGHPVRRSSQSPPFLTSQPRPPLFSWMVPTRTRRRRWRPMILLATRPERSSG